MRVRDCVDKPASEPEHFEMKPQYYGRQTVCPEPTLDIFPSQIKKECSTTWEAPKFERSTDGVGSRGALSMLASQLFILTSKVELAAILGSSVGPSKLVDPLRSWAV